jgi:Berberine and berberine like
MAGYVLGGGHSPTMGRTYGWAADHVQALEVVTAEGALHRVTGSCDAELFWALRGGKSNFGVVTALELDLFPVTTYFGGGLYYDGAHTATVLHAYRQWIAQAPEELNSSVALLRMPPLLPSVPEPLRGRLVVHVRVSYLGSPEDAERLVAPLRALVPPIIDTLAQMPYAQYASIHQDPSDQMPYQERTGLLRELTAEGVDALVQAAGPDSGSGIAIVELRHLGGALARPPKLPNAVGNRDAALTIIGVALGGPDEITSALAQTEELLMRMAPWSTGGRYLNFMSGAEPVETAYSAETYQRLRTVKTAYDPRNVFRLNNHNVLPLD